MTEWKLKLFGEFDLSLNDGTEITVLGRRDRAVLTYLALTPNQRESRERLAALLWSNRGDEQARHSLAQSTAVIRKALGDADKSVVVSEPASLAIDWTKFDVDVLTFRRLVDEGTLESLGQAVALHAEDLLPGFEVRSEGFDDWIDGERNRLRHMAVDAHYRLTSLHARAGDWEAVVEAAKRTLALDVLREDAHRLLMRAYAQTGQRALALQHYKSLVEVLENELQVEPDAETEALMEDIKAGRFSVNQNGEALTNDDQKQENTPADAATMSLDIRSRRFRISLYWAASGLGVALLAIVIGVSATFWRVPELAPAPIGAYIRDIKESIAPHPLSIAILPFEIHGDSDTNDFAEALSGGITTALSISSDMVVLSRSEVRTYSVAPTGVRDIAKKLKVRYFLEGSVQKRGDQIGIEIGLIDTQLGQHRIWSEAYLRRAEDFIQFQQDVTFDVITSLEIRLTEGEQERINRMNGTRILGAWLAAARGKKHLRLLTPQDNLIARASYERALEIDPQYAGALEGMSWTYFIGARFGWAVSRQKSALKAMQFAEQALALDPERPQTFSLLGSLSLLAGDFSNAILLGEKAVSLDPNDSDAAALLAYTLTYTGEPERAISLINRATSLRPVPPQWYEWLRGRAYRLTGRYSKAVEILAAATRDTPTSPVPLIELAAAYSEMGNPVLAKRTANEIMRLSPQFTVRNWISMSPYEDQRALDDEVAALRGAGLPD
ncbi:MAG: BTAD domain-containing putative transcriptional regulator [Alphaproteobacteria bacterium]|nr:BTAD domain-containing putative transcriptional regulator [Alphaproteobacteria bacterium]